MTATFANAASATKPINPTRNPLLAVTFCRFLHWSHDYGTTTSNTGFRRCMVCYRVQRYNIATGEKGLWFREQYQHRGRTA